MEFGHYVRVLRNKADFTHGADVDDRGGQTLAMAVLHECVEECVGCTVVGLAPLSCDAAVGGEEDEEVEVARQGVVEVPGAGDFGLDGGRPVRIGQFRESDVLRIVSSV